MLWIFVVSIASAKVSGGRIPANRLASIVLPEPGRSNEKDIMSAARGDFEGAFCGGLAANVAKIRRGRGFRDAVSIGGNRRELLGAGKQGDNLGEAPDSVNVHALDDRGFGGIFGRHDEIRDALLPAQTATESAPRTGRIAPSSDSSPSEMWWSRPRRPMAPRIPSAIGRSNPAPSFRTFAGARLMVMRLADSRSRSS